MISNDLRPLRGATGDHYPAGAIVAVQIIHGSLKKEILCIYWNTCTYILFSYFNFIFFLVKMEEIKLYELLLYR